MDAGSERDGVEDVAHAGEVNDVDGNRVLTCLGKGRGGGEEDSLQVEELTLRNVEFGKQSIDGDTFRTALDGATRLRKLKVEDENVEAVLAVLIPEDEQEGRQSWKYIAQIILRSLLRLCCRLYLFLRFIGIGSFWQAMNRFTARLYSPKVDWGSFCESSTYITRSDCNFQGKTQPS